MELRARLAALEQRVAEVSQSTGKVWGAVGSAGSGGGGAVPSSCLSPPAIPAGARARADVYSVSAGPRCSATTGATIYNEYNSAVAAGKVCTLGCNNDGTYVFTGKAACNAGLVGFRRGGVWMSTAGHDLRSMFDTHIYSLYPHGAASERWRYQHLYSDMAYRQYLERCRFQWRVYL